MTTLTDRRVMLNAKYDGWGFILRRARKSWDCQMNRRTKARPETHRRWDNGPPSPRCTEVISPGTQYVEWTGESPPFESGWRFCVGCCIATGIVEESR